MAKETMDQYAKRRGREREGKMRAKEGGHTPPKGKDSPDSKGPGRNGWTKGNKPPKGC